MLEHVFLLMGMLEIRGHLVDGITELHVFDRPAQLDAGLQSAVADLLQCGNESSQRLQQPPEGGGPEDQDKQNGTDTHEQTFLELCVDLGQKVRLGDDGAQIPVQANRLSGAGHSNQVRFVIQHDGLLDHSFRLVPCQDGSELSDQIVCGLFDP